ncbi:serine/threonine-protein kinase CTR1 [Dioscorea cayenensis subsp. rotundata]|uniref:non-specific serine/threonine protein kinase n=1 Tax=Dioscorea cayennensis subsp. rotundata TaxID=55577 RepID=A0AB40AYP9_DIOCR|nr:serine/threonine-protein kinase CTR1 [Dioscorea cayenensis subsp. rotundata]
MEMPGRRSGYSLLSQYPNDQLPPKFESPPSDKARPKPSPFDWTIAADPDHRGMRISAGYPSIGLQRQSSGSSFGESSLSGDYYLPATLSTAAMDPEGFGPSASGGDVRVKDGTEGIGPTGSPSKSWAQQAEETYQLQLALALRLCSEATCASDPNFLDPGDQMLPSDRTSAEALSHRFWVNGCLSYYDKVPDGFYLIQGMDPFVWTICTDVQEDSRIPSIESLKTVQPSDLSIEVALIDRQSDPDLRQLQNMVVALSCSCSTTQDVVDQLAKLVCSRMGGAAFKEEDSLLPRWKDCSEAIRASAGSVVLSLGKLSVGLCRHRALLFKMLADTINLPCRVAKGCKYCKRDDASSCLVRFGLEREYIVDLIGNPGFLCEPGSLLNGPSSISISSPLRLPKYKAVGITKDFRSLAKQYFLDCQSLNLMFSEASTGTTSGRNGAVGPSTSKNYDEKYVDVKYFSPVTSSDIEVFEAADTHGKRVAPPVTAAGISTVQKGQNLLETTETVEYMAYEADRLKPIKKDGNKDVSPLLPAVDPKADKNKDSVFTDEHRQVRNKPNNDIALAMDGLNIPWAELILKERIGAGSFGTVHRADWNGSEVAVKILMEQDFHPERFKEFLREVGIMKSLRHPNIVLFMGAVTQPPNLSIVTEYLSRGSLFRLLHKPGAREILDEKRRLTMAFDVAKGMNYLHRRNPPIVHRDLKSPNLLVDKKYTVKVCDFGLSRLKANTFLSSKSLAGTPEWMAPEVLRDEPSNEKSDVYSFGVILWELMTLQQPWSNLNPAQVVAAVGFKGRRLEIPNDVNPNVARIIESCWASEPWKRPSFSNIMESLRPLIKPLPPQPVRNEMTKLT